MLTGIIATVAVVLFLAFFAIYKRRMLVRLFTLNAAAPAGELTEQLEKTADAAISRLEKQLAHLELLIEEADVKIAELDRRLQLTAEMKTPDIAEKSSPSDTPPADFSSGVDFILPAENPFLLLPPEAESSEEEPPLSAKDGKEALSADKRRLILSMAGQGYSVTDIAKATGFGRGEVLLVLQLNKK